MYTLTKRVLPQHTDYAGVMWHGAYVQWLEEARVEALQAAGLGYAAMTAMGVDMPVVSLHLDYRQPLRHGDEVCVESRCPGQQGGALAMDLTLCLRRRGGCGGVGESGDGA